MKRIAILLIFCLLGAEIFAQSTAGSRTAAAESFPRLEPDPKALEYARRAARSGGYSWTDMAEISLWASGEPAAGRGGSPSMERLRAAAAELRSSPELPAAGRERAEYVLAFMHKKLLRSYSLNQTRVDTLLSGGRYNCVSSAVLYMILAMSAGLDVSGVMTGDHAFAAVHLRGGDIDVETTNPYGFDPGSRREFHDQFGKLTGFAYVPARNYRDRAAISPIELVSLIISNRISELETRNRFAEAVPLAVDRAALLTGEKYSVKPAAGGSLGVNGNPPASGPTPFFEDPRQDMMNRLFNYGAFLLNAGREEDCLRWTAFAAPQYPDEKRWQEFVLAAVNNRVQKQVKAGQTGAAREFLDSQRMTLSFPDYAMLDSILIDAELLSGASRIRSVNDGNSVLAAIEQARDSKRLDTGRSAEILNFAIQKTAAILSAAPGRDWLAAIDYIEKAITRFGSSRELEQTLRNYQTNRAADFHNRFAAAYNRRNFEEAAQIIHDGLAEFPANRQLLSDRDVLEKPRR